MNKAIWRLHSWSGLVAGLGLLVIGLTGSILVFRAEIGTVLDPLHSRLPEAADAPRLPLDTLFAKARGQRPADEVVAWSIQADPRAPDICVVRRRSDGGSEQWLNMNQHTGWLLPPATGKAAFLDWVLDLHESLLMNDWGTVLAGLLAAMLCALGISGFWLYRGFWRSFFRLRWRASARIFCSDLHKAIGISSVFFNLILGFTGAYWNLPALADVLSPPAAPAGTAPKFYLGTLSPEGLLAQAKAAIPDLDTRAAYVNFPPRYEDITIRCAVPTHNPFRSDTSSTVSFDPQTGQLKQVIDIRRAPLWTQVEDMMSPLHYGSFGGLPIKVLWCLGGLTPGTLAVSGFMIWRSRRRTRPIPSSNTSRQSAVPLGVHSA